MSKTAYHISLKGYVGGYDFDRGDVDAVLAENDGKQVNVLIDSLGGELAAHCRHVKSHTILAPICDFAHREGE